MSETVFKSMFVSFLLAFIFTASAPAGILGAIFKGLFWSGIAGAVVHAFEEGLFQNLHFPRWSWSHRRNYSYYDPLIIPEPMPAPYYVPPPPPVYVSPPPPVVFSRPAPAVVISSPPARIVVSEPAPFVVPQPARVVTPPPPPSVPATAHHTETHFEPSTRPLTPPPSVPSTAHHTSTAFISAPHAAPFLPSRAHPTSAGFHAAPAQRPPYIPPGAKLVSSFFRPAGQ